METEGTSDDEDISQTDIPRDVEGAPISVGGVEDQKPEHPACVTSQGEDQKEEEEEQWACGSEVAEALEHTQTSGVGSATQSTVE